MSPPAKKETKKPTASKTTQKKVTPSKKTSTEAPDPMDALLEELSQAPDDTASEDIPQTEDDLTDLLTECLNTLDDDSETILAEPGQATGSSTPKPGGEIATIMAQKAQKALRRPAEKKEQKILQDRRCYLELLAWRDAFTDAGEENIIEHNNMLPSGQFSPFISHSSSKWPIQYWAGNEEYASLMSSSIGIDTYRGLDNSNEAVYRGTWRYQSFVTAVEMTILAKKQGWGGIRIIDGVDFMVWATWATAQRLKIPIEFDIPFSEEKKDQKKSERTDHLFEQLFTLNAIDLTPSSTATPTPTGMGSTAEDTESETS